MMLNDSRDAGDATHQEHGASDAAGAALAIYRSACAAVLEAKTIDEVLEIKSRAAAIRAYAIQVKNRELEMDAVEVRLRATRRIGQILNAALSDGFLDQIAASRRKPLSEKHLLLAFCQECGINYNVATLARRMAALSDEHHTKLIGEWRQRCRDENKVTARLLPREPEPQQSRYQPEPPPPRPPGPLDNYYTGLDSYPIGDMLAREVVATIEWLETDLKVLRAIRRHIGDWSHLEDGARKIVQVRDLISNRRLATILKSFGVSWNE